MNGIIIVATVFMSISILSILLNIATYFIHKFTKGGEI